MKTDPRPLAPPSDPSRAPSRAQRGALLAGLLLLAGCAQVNSAVSYIDALPLVGSGKAEAKRAAARMVDPDADCRRTLGIPECIVYIAPPGRQVPRGPITPGDAQIELARMEPEASGGPSQGRRTIPTGTFMSEDGSRAPLGRAADMVAEMAVPPVVVNTSAINPEPVSTAPLARPPQVPASKPTPPRTASPKPRAGGSGASPAPAAVPASPVRAPAPPPSAPPALPRPLPASEPPQRPTSAPTPLSPILTP